MICNKNQLVLFFVFLLAGFNVRCQQENGNEKQATSADIPQFSAPESINEVDGKWQQDGFWLYQEHGNPYSPRKLSAITGPKYDVYSFDDAIKDFQKDAGVIFTKKTVLEKLEAWKQWDGRDLRVGLIPTKFANTKGILFLLISKEKNSDQYKLMAVELAEKTFREWGGIPRMLVLRNIIDSVEVYPEEKREAIANAALPNQVALYEASLDALVEEFGLAMTMYTQHQLFMRMQELNYDIILGDDITNPDYLD